MTPRDVIDLITRAKQFQANDYEADADGETDHVIGSPAIIYGLRELSTNKRTKFLKAEFPHFWKDIERFEGGKATYDEAALVGLFGDGWPAVVEELVAIGFLQRVKVKGKEMIQIPYLYRHGMGVTQGVAS